MRKFALYLPVAVLLLLSTTACSLVDVLNFSMLGVLGTTSSTVIAPIGPVEANDEAPIPDGALERYLNIPYDFSEEGYPQLGDPDAEVEMLVFGSFSCIHCSVFEDNVFENILDRIESGEVHYTYAPMYLPGNIPNGLEANRAALCGGEQGKFWVFQETLYYWHSLYEADKVYVPERIRDAAIKLDLDMDQWDECMSNDDILVAVYNAEDQSRTAKDFTGTPTTYINGVHINSDFDSITTELDRLLQGNA